MLFVIFVLILSMFLISFLSTFQTGYKDLIVEMSNRFDVDYTLVLAIAKAESKFNVNAKSSACAIGMMQIKLETANYMQQIYGNDILTENELFIPENNILCGVEYINYLFQKFENADVVICAYNAGETVVRSWLSDNDYSKDGKTLSKIPYQETKNYLKKVRFNQKIYEKLNF